MEFVTLNNGVKMPILGYGVYQVNNEECERCVLDAISVGFFTPRTKKFLKSSIFFILSGLVVIFPHIMN